MTTENNKIISEFLGNKPSNNGLYTINGKTTRPSELIYHSDWNWLMEVVEKIESLGYGFNFFFKKDKCYVSISNFESNVFVGANGVDYNTQPNKIEAAYNACVTFIEWYNKQTAQEK